MSLHIDLNRKYNAISYSWETAELSLGEIFSLSQKTLLYVYPRDNTPGCTLENKDFSCLVSEFKNLGVTLIWLSQDEIESHKKFIGKHDLKIDLLSDPEHILHTELWAYWEKNTYGIKSIGVIRSTFLFDSKWELIHSWKNVKATGHAQKILKELQK